MKPAYDALIFDLDGTLWNSTVPVTQAWNEAARALGTGPVSSETIQSIMGLPHDECFRRAFPHLSESERKRLAAACTQVEMELLRDHGAMLFPGVRDGLQQLARKFSLFVVSNCETDYLRIFLKNSGVGNLFRDSECYGNNGLTKGQNLRKLAARNRLRQPCYIGDTAGDQQAATAAGMDYYHVNYGFGDPDRECLAFDDFQAVVAFFFQI